MKKLFCILFAIMLTFPAATSAAEDKAALVSAFAQGGKLYTYSALPDSVNSSAISAVVVAGDKIIYPEKNASAAEMLPATSYLVLLDVSGSMDKYTDSVRLFLERFRDSAKGKLSFAFATIGDEYSFIGEYSDADELSAAIGSVEYNADYTNVYDSLIEAAEYYNQKSRGAGQLFSIILISDGEDNRSGANSGGVIEKLKASTPVIVHSVLVNSQSSAAMRDFAELTNGVYGELTADDSSAVTLADKVARYVNGFYAARFALPALARGTEVTLSILLDGQSAYTFDITDAPALGVTAASPGGAVPEAAASVEITPAPGVSAAPELSASAEAAETAPELVNPPKPESEPNTILVRFSATLSIIIGGTIMIIAIRRIRGKKRRGRGILLTFVISGGAQNGERFEQRLSGELFVGTSGACDVRLRDDGADAKNSRIYLNGDTIWVEDLGSVNGTSIGGMKIHAPNKLRSGSELTIGQTTLIVKY
ncbi:MAG: FHA domain-containing protein [Oscillospiraceae bacterium]|jgi:hypothetical protein|nr:FHA domain-containing protein [Oscillospiraceae bacterium]